MVNEDHVLDLARLRRSCAVCGLHQLCLPASMQERELKRLDDILQGRRPLNRGEPLFLAGQRLRGLFVVRSGSFKSFHRNLQGETQVVGFHLPGEIVGFDALAEEVHQVSAEALERSSVCEVPYTHLLEVAQEVPGLQRQLMRLASQELVHEHQQLIMMGRRQAQERIVIFLRSLSDRYRRLGHSGLEFVLPMSRYELANYLGLVVETVSRQFTRLTEMGVVEVRRRLIRVVDPARLEALCGEQDSDSDGERSLRAQA